MSPYVAIIGQNTGKDQAVICSLLGLDQQSLTIRSYEDTTSLLAVSGEKCRKNDRLPVDLLVLMFDMDMSDGLMHAYRDAVQAKGILVFSRKMANPDSVIVANRTAKVRLNTSADGSHHREAFIVATEKKHWPPELVRKQA